MTSPSGSKLYFIAIWVSTGWLMKSISPWSSSFWADRVSSFFYSTLITSLVFDFSTITSTFAFDSWGFLDSLISTLIFSFGLGNSSTFIFTFYGVASPSSAPLFFLNEVWVTSVCCCWTSIIFFCCYLLSWLIALNNWDSRCWLSWTIVLRRCRYYSTITFFSLLAMSQSKSKIWLTS